MRSFYSNALIKSDLAGKVSEIHKDNSSLNPALCISDCPLHAGSLNEIEIRLSIPVTILALADSLNYALELDDSAFWYDRFIRAIAPGSDLSLVFSQYAQYLFEDKKVGISQVVAESIRQIFTDMVIALQTPTPDLSRLSELRDKLLQIDNSTCQTRMTSGGEPGLLIVEFARRPDKKVGSDMLMAFAAQFQYGRKGKSWRYLSRAYAERFLSLLMDAPILD